MSRGRTPRNLVDATPARQHVQAMLDLGSECGAIDVEAGLPEMTCWRLVHRTAARIVRTTSDSLLSLSIGCYISRRYRTECIGLPDGVSHGTRTGYQKGCGCSECVSAQARYDADREINGKSRVPAEPVRVHIERLVAQGCKPSWIAKAADVDYCTLYNVRRGKFATMQRAKADAILAVSRVEFTDWQYVDAASTLALIDKLWRQGYSKAWIAEQMGHCVPKSGQRFVRVFLARAVADLAVFVGDSPGTCRGGSSLFKRLPVAHRRLIPAQFRHGTVTAYHSGCRCDLCVDAKRAARRAERRRAA